MRWRSSGISWSGWKRCKRDGPGQTGRTEDIMTIEEKRIERLYTLLRKIERTDPDMAAVLRWAIFELERIYPA